MAWTTNIEVLPRFNILDVEKWAEEGCRIPRAVLLNGYINWIEGCVTDIEDGLLLAEYNGRLAAELEDRRQLARMLTEYIQSQKEALNEREKKLEKKQSNPDADDDEDEPREDTPLNSNINGASKPTTDEFLEMVGLTKCSVDNNNQRSKKDLNHGA